MDESALPLSATTENVMTASVGLPVDAGVAVALPGAGPVPEMPVNLDTRSLPEEDDAPSLPPAPTMPGAEAQVNAVLGQFQAAYSRLDAGSVQTIWPSVDRTRLARAFRNLAWQDLAFTGCRLELAESGATATCTGAVEYVTRVGNQHAREARTWTFSLRKGSAGWLIQNVLVR